MSILSPAERETLRARLKAWEVLATRQSSTSALEYLRYCVINKAAGPCLFREVAEPWQWQLASRITPALEAVAGLNPGYSGPRSFFVLLPRGHDKTSLIGRLCSWLLAFSKRPVRVAAGAADKEQAGYISEFMLAEARLNPWLHSRLDFRNWLVTGTETDSRLRILSADDKGAFGLSEDVMVLDELTHWPKQDLFNTLVSGLEKRAGQAVLIIISNAGVLRTWQHETWLTAQANARLPDGDPRKTWYVYQAPHHLASWMSIDRISEMRKLLPAPLAKRVLDNKWIDLAEDSGFCTRVEAERTVRPGLFRRERGLKEHRPFFAGLDYGPVRDRTVGCVGHYDRDTREFVLDRLDVWEGKNFAGGRVPIALVDAWIDEVEKAFHHPTFVVDPFNLESSLQRIEGSYDVVRFEPRAGRANFQLAANLRSLIVNDHLAVYPAAGEVVVNGRPHSFVDELAEVTLEMRSYGYRINTDGNNHDDRVIAIGMASLQAIQSQAAIRIATSGRWF